MGELIETSESYVGQIERGTKNLTLNTLERIANALGVDPTVLLDQQTNPYLIEVQNILHGRNDEDLKKAAEILLVVFPTKK